jgi:hypothetical protein
MALAHPERVQALMVRNTAAHDGGLGMMDEHDESEHGD